MAALIKLSLADELAGDNPDLRRQLRATGAELEAGIAELRDLAHGLYPIELADRGLAGALLAMARRVPDRITVTASKERFSPEIEAAFYYCCVEAVQNALKHAGPHAHTSIRLFTSARDLHLEVRDTGPGFDPAHAHKGLGLQSMQDRLAAVGGHTEIVSTPGHGTVVAAVAPSR